MTPRQRAGIKGAAVIRQRQSRANYEDIRHALMLLGTDLHLVAVRQIVMYQRMHRENSVKARKLLFRLIGDK